MSVSNQLDPQKSWCFVPSLPSSPLIHHDQALQAAQGLRVFRPFPDLLALLAHPKKSRAKIMTTGSESGLFVLGLQHVNVNWRGKVFVSQSLQVNQNIIYKLYRI